jgi:hypothetical protein
MAGVAVYLHCDTVLDRREEGTGVGAIVGTSPLHNAGAFLHTKDL